VIRFSTYKPNFRVILLFAIYLCAALATMTVFSQSPNLISTEAAHRIEVIVRNHFNIPPDMQMTMSQTTASDIPGYNNLIVTVTSNGKDVGKVTLLLSADKKTMLGVVRFDLTQASGNFLPIDGRPIRGNPNAPVKIIVFDDLECPYCALMHTTLFPRTFDHYKDKVAYIYKDFPLTDIHPWAMRAAVDVNCIAELNTPASNAAYWQLVDHIHAQSSEISSTPAPNPTPTAKSGAPENKAAPDKKAAAMNKADDKPATPAATAASQKLNAIYMRLDKMTLDQARTSGLNTAAVNACLKVQNQAIVTTSIKQAEALKLDATPTLYVDGEKMDGVIDIDVLWDRIDDALLAYGVQPPPRPVAATPVSVPTTATPLTKP